MRCPFRMKGFDQPDTCDHECAWRMTYEPAPGGLDISPTSSCAVAILAQDANCSYGVRFEGEDNDEVCANDVVAAGEFDALDEYAQTLERENAELRKRCGANDALASEKDVSAASVGANDSHAKLEEDWTEFYTTHERECLYQSDVGQFVFDLLDRQAAITERHWMEIVGASANANVELKRQIDERQARVDELTAELTAARNAHAQAEHEAVILREKLGRALDYAHEITSVGGDC